MPPNHHAGEYSGLRHLKKKLPIPMAMFAEEVDDIQRKEGRRMMLAHDELIEGWREFVELCSYGYPMNIYEYENDLSIRNVIEKVLLSQNLKQYLQYFEFAEKINSIDLEFKTLLNDGFVMEGRVNWWNRSVLKEAGKEYAEDIKSLYDVEVRIKSEL